MKTLLTTAVAIATLTSSAVFAENLDNQAQQFVSKQAEQVENAIENQLLADIQLAVKTLKMPIIETKESKLYRVAKVEEDSTAKDGE